jgi:hypothetical protein
MPTNFQKIIALLLFLFGSAAHGQEIDKRIIRILEKEMAYDVALYGSFKARGDSFVQYPTIRLIINSPDIHKIQKKIGAEELILQLIYCLDNPMYDWKANLLLYAITKRWAAIFMAIKNRDEWIKEYREKDIRYWTKTYLNK